MEISSEIQTISNLVVRVLVLVRVIVLVLVVVVVVVVVVFQSPKKKETPAK